MEWEEGVGGYCGVFYFQIFVSCFNFGDFGGVYVVYLVCVYVDGYVFFGIYNGVGFYEFCYFLVEQCIVQFLFSWLVFRDYVQFSFVYYIQIFVLNQQVVVNVFKVEVWYVLCLLVIGQDVNVLFSGSDFQCFFGCRWCDDYFDKLVGDDGLCGFSIQFVVKGDDVVECGGWVGFIGVIVSVENRGIYCYVVWVSVFDDYVGWFVECFYIFQCCVGIGDVVVGKCFVLNLLYGGNGCFFYIFFYIEGSLLVVVFVVVYILFFNEVQIQCMWEVIGGFFVFIVVGWNYVVEVVSDYVVVGGGVFEGFNCEIEMGVEGQRIFVSIYFFNNGVVVVVFYYDSDVFMVFCSRVYYGWVVDIDVFYCIFQ